VPRTSVSCVTRVTAMVSFRFRAAGLTLRTEAAWLLPRFTERVAVTGRGREGAGRLDFLATEGF